MTARAEAGAGHQRFQLITNETGRVFRVGETPKELLPYGRWLPGQYGRWAPIFAAWAVMFMAGLLEYTFGVVEGPLQAKFGWSDSGTFWMLSIYVVFEAGISFPTGWLRERGILSARWAVIIGGALCGIPAYLITANAKSIWLAYFGYAVLGGIGSGMCYSTCVNIVNKWYPDKKGFRTGLIDGGFAYGALPWIIALGALGAASGASGMAPNAASSFIITQGITITCVIVFFGIFIIDPPKNWWPAYIDPLKWSVDAARKKVTDLLRNPPAPRHVGPKAMWRTPQPKWMGIQFALFVGSSLFGVTYYFPFATAMHLGSVAAVGGFAGFGLADGVCRPVYGKVSELLGRRQTMILIYACNAVTQMAAYFAGVGHVAWLFAILAVISGGFSGANFALTPSLVADYYGESTQASNYGTIYAWKMVGGSFASGIAALIMTGTLTGQAHFHWGFGFAFGALLAVLAVLVVAFLCKRPTDEQYQRAFAVQEAVTQDVTPSARGAVA